MLKDVTLIHANKNQVINITNKKNIHSSKSPSNSLSSSKCYGSLPMNLNTVCSNKKQNMKNFLNFNQMPCGKFFGYRTNSHFGFNSPQFPNQCHFHLPRMPSKYVPLRRSKSMDEIFATDKFLEDYNQCSPNLIMKIKRKLNFQDEPLDKIASKYKNKPNVNEDANMKSSKLSSLEKLSEKNQNVRIPSEDLDEFKQQEALAEMGEDEVMEDNSRVKRKSDESHASHASSEEMFSSSLIKMTIEAVIARMIDPSPDKFDESLTKHQLTPISPAQKNLMKIIDEKLAEKSLLMQTTFLQKLQEISYSKVSPVLFPNATSAIKNELPTDSPNSPEKEKVFTELWNNIPYIDFEMEATCVSGTASAVLQIDENEHQIENESIINISSDDSCTFSVDYGKENVLNESKVDENTQCETTVLMTSSDSCVSTRNFSFSTPTHSINNLFSNENFFNFGCTSLSESEGECGNKITPTTSRIPVRASRGSRSSTHESKRKSIIDRLSSQSTHSLKSSERPSFTRHSSTPLNVIIDSDLVLWRDSKYDEGLATTSESIGGSCILRRSVTKSINKCKRNFINENIRNIARFSNPKKGNPSSIFSSGNPFNDDDGSVSTFEKKKTSKDNSLWLSFSPSLSAHKKKKENTPKSAKVVKHVQRPLILEKTKLVIEKIIMAQQKNDQDHEKSRIKELDDLDEIHDQLSLVCYDSSAEDPGCNLKQCNNDLENIFRMHQELENERQQQREEMDAKNNNDLNFLRGITLNLSENDD